MEILLAAGAIWCVSLLWLFIIIWRAPLLDNDEALGPLHAATMEGDIIVPRLSPDA